MENPFDVYNDNRAYMGYLQAVKDLRQVAKGLSDYGVIMLCDFLEKTEVKDDRFRYLLDEE